LRLPEQRARLRRERGGRKSLGAAPQRKKVVLGEGTPRAHHAQLEHLIAERRVSERHGVHLPVVRELHVEADGGRTPAQMMTVLGSAGLELPREGQRHLGDGRAPAAALRTQKTQRQGQARGSYKSLGREHHALVPGADGAFDVFHVFDVFDVFDVMAR
jgi:hypothetical protein